MLKKNEVYLKFEGMGDSLDLFEAMDEWAKQALGEFLVELKKLREDFQKEKQQLLDLLEPHLRPVYRYKLYGEIPKDNEIIDKWYNQYLERINNKTPS